MLFFKIVFGVVLAFGAGIFFASFLFSSYFFIIPLLAIGIMLISVFWRRWSVVRVGILFVAVAFGMVHYVTAIQLPEPLFEPQDISFLSFVVKTFSEFPFAAGSVEGFPMWVLLPLLLPASFFAWRAQQGQKFQFMEQRMI